MYDDEREQQLDPCRFHRGETPSRRILRAAERVPAMGTTHMMGGHESEGMKGRCMKRADDVQRVVVEEEDADFHRAACA